MSEEMDYVNEVIAEETSPAIFPSPKYGSIELSGTRLLNVVQIEQVRTIIREEIAEAMKQLLNEPAKKLVHEIVMYPEQDSM